MRKLLILVLLFPLLAIGQAVVPGPIGCVGCGGGGVTYVGPIGDLPTACTEGNLAWINDGLNDTDCGTGGGTTYNLCGCTAGNSWVNEDSAGSGGSPPGGTDGQVQLRLNASTFDGLAGSVMGDALNPAYLQQATAATRVPIAVRGFAGQSANLFEAQNSVGSSVAHIDFQGDIYGRSRLGYESDPDTYWSRIGTNNLGIVAGGLTAASITGSNINLPVGVSLTLNAEQVYAVTSPGTANDCVIFSSTANRFTTLNAPCAPGVLQAKGDIMVYDGVGYKNLTVGTNGQVLKANSAAANGIEWGDESGGGGGGNMNQAVAPPAANKVSVSTGVGTEYQDSPLTVDAANGNVSTPGTLTLGAPGNPSVIVYETQPALSGDPGGTNLARFEIDASTGNPCYHLTGEANARCYSNRTIDNIPIAAPETGDSDTAQTKYPYPIRIIRLTCSTDTGTVDIQADERAEGTPNTSGTNIMATVLSCTTTTGAQTSFTNGTIAANAPLNWTVSAVASATKLRVHLEYAY